MDVFSLSEFNGGDRRCHPHVPRCIDIDLRSPGTAPRQGPRGRERLLGKVPDDGPLQHVDRSDDQGIRAPRNGHREGVQIAIGRDVVETALEEGRVADFRIEIEVREVPPPTGDRDAPVLSDLPIERADLHSGRIQRERAPDRLNPLFALRDPNHAVADGQRALRPDPLGGSAKPDRSGERSGRIEDVPREQTENREVDIRQFRIKPDRAIHRNAARPPGETEDQRHLPLGAIDLTSLTPDEAVERESLKQIGRGEEHGIRLCLIETQVADAAHDPAARSRGASREVASRRIAPLTPEAIEAAVSSCPGRMVRMRPVIGSADSTRRFLPPPGTASSPTFTILPTLRSSMPMCPARVVRFSISDDGSRKPARNSGSGTGGTTTRCVARRRPRPSPSPAMSESTRTVPFSSSDPRICRFPTGQRAATIPLPSRRARPDGVFVVPPIDASRSTRPARDESGKPKRSRATRRSIPVASDFAWERVAPLPYVEVRVGSRRRSMRARGPRSSRCPGSSRLCSPPSPPTAAGCPAGS